MRDRLEPERKAQYDKKIRERILAHPAYREAQAILAYASYRSEADTTALIRQALADGKAVFAPKVFGEEMEFWQIASPGDLRSGYQGIPEPVERISFPEWMRHIEDDGEQAGSQDQGKIRYPVMMWMPGAVFDRERHRIGYGKGFYDRYLHRLYARDRESFREKNRMVLTTAALAYDFQVVDKLPWEAHDVKPDMVITEAGIVGEGKPIR